MLWEHMVIDHRGPAAEVLAAAFDGWSAYVCWRRAQGVGVADHRSGGVRGNTWAHWAVRDSTGQIFDWREGTRHMARDIGLIIPDPYRPPDRSAAIPSGPSWMRPTLGNNPPLASVL